MAGPDRRIAAAATNLLRNSKEIDMKVIRAAAYIFFCLLLATPASALADDKGSSKCEACSNCAETGGHKFDLVFDLSRDAATGNKIRGPATIKLVNANVLRYDIQVGAKVTWSAGPKIDLTFIPKISEPAAKPAQPAAAATEAAKAKAQRALTDANNLAPTAKPPSALQKAWEDILTDWDADEEELGGIRGDILRITSEVNDVSSRTLALVTSSDATLQAGGAKALADSVTELIKPISQATQEMWPDKRVNDLAIKLRLLTNRLVELPSKYPVDWASWRAENDQMNGRIYDQLKARLDTLVTVVQGLTSASDEAKKFAEAKDGLARWGVIFAGISVSREAAFCIIYRVSCSFTFDSNKETLVSVVKRDRLSVAKASDKDTSTASGKEGAIEIVTVVCSSPLSVSAGFGFSTIDEKEFVFIQSTKAVVGANGATTQKAINLFGFKNNSSFRTLPVLLLNTRLWEPSDWFAIHASAGAAVDIKTGQAGTDIEYIVGGSFSFWRSMFVTPALHIGRVPTLVGGFTLGQEVPEGIKEPPVEKAWKKGFAVTFTYRIR
jgi:hypothetical protein